MKTYSLILITLLMSSSACASIIGLQTSKASCISGCTSVSVGNELTQGLVGYDRQVQRVMKQVNDGGPVGAVSYSVQPQ